MLRILGLDDCDRDARSIHQKVVSLLLVFTGDHASAHNDLATGKEILSEDLGITIPRLHNRRINEFKPCVRLVHTSRNSSLRKTATVGVELINFIITMQSSSRFIRNEAKQSQRRKKAPKKTKEPRRIESEVIPGAPPTFPPLSTSAADRSARGTCWKGASELARPSPIVGVSPGRAGSRGSSRPSSA